MTVKPDFSVPFKTYEELAGASGRHMFFRAPRVRARELFDNDIVQLTINGAVYKLHDLSMSGFSAVSPTQDADSISLGNVVPINLARNGTAFFESVGKIVRVEPTYRGNKIGVQLVNDTADIHQLRKLHCEQIFTQPSPRTDERPLGEIDLPFRSMCTEVLEFLRGYKTDLEYAERINPGLKSDAMAQSRLLDLCEARALPQWEKFVLEGNRFISTLNDDASALQEMRRLSVALLTHEFLSSPVWWQSFMKPFGYPGDFMMMNYVYDGSDYGASLYDKFLHRLGLRSSHFLFTRMQAVRGHIERTIAAHGSGPVRILCLACGSAEELVTYLSKGVRSGPLHLTLIDQDSRALTFAYERILPLLNKRGDGSTIHCLQVTFTKLLRGGELAKDFVQQDLIYSVGLLDYLKPRRAKLLVESLYDQVKPGGSLLIGNLRESPASCRWVTEMLCDWDLLFRTEQDMLNLSASLDFTDQRISIDETGQIYLLALQKSGAA